MAALSFISFFSLNFVTYCVSNLDKQVLKTATEIDD